MIDLELPPIWAGTEECFDVLVRARVEALDLLRAGTMQAKRGAAEDPFALPALYTAQDGVAVVPVKGPLISGSAGFMRLFGVTGYDDIRQGLMEAAADKSVKAMLLDVKSGGGAVAGVEDTSNLIRSVSAIKPVVTFADGAMASAAYWLGSSAQKIFATKTSIVGSIGVIVTHMERSKQLADAGIGVNVIRSGKYKSLVNSVEPLSETARTQLEAMVADMNDIFEAGVATNLGISAKQVRERMGEGREFLGEKAVKAGLLTGLATFEEAFAVAKILGKA